MVTQRVHEWAKDGNVRALASILDANPNLINEPDSSWLELPPIHYAVEGGSLPCIQLLLDRGADINSRSNNGSTPIFSATTPEVAEFLVQQGAQLNIVNDRSRGLLDWAVHRHHVDLVRYLIAQGLDVNHRPTPTCFCTMTQWAIANTRASSHSTEKHLALETLEVLLDAGSDPNQQNVMGATVLYEACRKGLLQCVERLLQHGADPCIRDVSGRSCFDVASPESLVLLEPYRVDLQPLELKQDSPDALVQRMLATGVARKEQLRGYSEAEITALETEQSITLPEAYKTFLRMLGKNAGSFWVNDHWEIFLTLGPDYFYFEDEFEKSLGIEPEEIDMPEKFVVFADRLGDYPLGFVADGSSDDPPILGPTADGTQLEQKFESFWAFFQSMVSYYEFFRDPGRFRQTR